MEVTKKWSNSDDIHSIGPDPTEEFGMGSSGANEEPELVGSSEAQAVSYFILFWWILKPWADPR